MRVIRLWVDTPKARQRALYKLNNIVYLYLRGGVK